MKYVLIQDVAFDIPAELGGGVVTYKTGNVVEGVIPDGGGAIIHVVHKTGKGDMVVSLPLEAVKEHTPEDKSKKWIYLGAALVLVYWYVTRDKKKKRQEIINGFSGVKKKDNASVIKTEYRGFEISEKMFADGSTKAVAVGNDVLMNAEASPNEYNTAYEKLAQMIDAYKQKSK